MLCHFFRKSNLFCTTVVRPSFHRVRSLGGQLSFCVLLCVHTAEQRIHSESRSGDVDLQRSLAYSRCRGHASHPRPGKHLRMAREAAQLLHGRHEHGPPQRRWRGSPGPGNLRANPAGNAEVRRHGRKLTAASAKRPQMDLLEAVCANRWFYFRHWKKRCCFHIGK